MHDSFTRNRYQRNNKLLYTDVYTNCRGSCNLVPSLNNNWMNGLHRNYYQETQKSNQSHKMGSMHDSFTRNKYQTNINIFYADHYTNCRWSCNLVPRLNKNWLNAWHSKFCQNTQNSNHSLKTGPMHDSSTRNKYEKTNNLFSTDDYTNRRGSCNLVPSLNNNGMNAWHSKFCQNT